MSAHGISPAWKQRSKFGAGQPWFFDPTAIHSFFLNCEIVADANDVQPIDLIGFLAGCDLVADENDIHPATPPMSFSAGCMIVEDEHDIQPIDQILFSAGCQVVDDNDIQIFATTISLRCGVVTV